MLSHAFKTGLPAAQFSRMRFSMRFPFPVPGAQQIDRTPLSTCEAWAVTSPGPDKRFAGGQSMLNAKLGMSPIAWWNDDLPELSEDVTIEECLRQSRGAGFTGMELGQRFPRDPDEMLPILRAADVTLCGGWFSGTLVNREMAENKDAIQPMIELFKAVDAPCIVYGECGNTIQGDRNMPLDRKARAVRRRDGGLWTQGDRVWRMVCRPGDASGLSSPHGAGGSVSARA